MCVGMTPEQVVAREKRFWELAKRAYEISQERSIYMIEAIEIACQELHDHCA